MKKAIVLLATIVVALTALAQREYSLSSPDGRLVATVQVEQGGMSYSVEYGNHFLTPTTVIGLRYEQGGKVYDKITVRKVSRRTIDETIPSPFSRQATMRNHCNEMTLTLKEGLSVVFRAYNEGVAYRYVWEGKPGKVFNEVAQCLFNADSATVPYVSQFDSTAFGSEPFQLSNAWTPQSALMSSSSSSSSISSSKRPLEAASFVKLSAKKFLVFSSPLLNRSASPII